MLKKKTLLLRFRRGTEVWKALSTSGHAEILIVSLSLSVLDKLTHLGSRRQWGLEKASSRFQFASLVPMFITRKNVFNVGDFGCEEGVGTDVMAGEGGALAKLSYSGHFDLGVNFLDFGSLAGRQLMSVKKSYFIAERTAYLLLFAVKAVKRSLIWEGIIETIICV
ncbi:uncharacterized protein BX663DRAFT_543363 [Cokeromyces recurvatus]|uniref:uncharacterized protein n=1 Tax=Cokeromyces recurvatus TaxID=90255 RepID=UPI00221EE19E|nr:uncharacterized protein BX663DRAFT_543363 [Cokeromyces recurvatus]KAI7902350.1 hypothetical protein BX663DRAFT_543363 [Cokeromyces recurvatus]